MVLTNRSIPLLYYVKEGRDGSVEFISSSRGTDEVVSQQSQVIKSNVVGNSVINYMKLTPTRDGCDLQTVLCVDIGGSIPDYLKRQSAERQLAGQERVMYLIRHGKAPKK